MKSLRKVEIISGIAVALVILFSLIIVLGGPTKIMVFLLLIFLAIFLLLVPVEIILIFREGRKELKEFEELLKKGAEEAEEKK